MNKFEQKSFGFGKKKFGSDTNTDTFFSESEILFQISQSPHKKYSKTLSWAWNLKFPISKQLIQIFWEYFFGEIGRFEKTNLTFWKKKYRYQSQNFWKKSHHYHNRSPGVLHSTSCMIWMYNSQYQLWWTTRRLQKQQQKRTMKLMILIMICSYVLSSKNDNKTCLF